MENKELTALVKKSQSGDEQAMEELLRAAYTPVSYQCRRFLKTGQDAEDMTQEILLLIYTKLDTLREPAAFWGWLGRLTATRCTNALTRTHTDLPLYEDEDGNSILDVMENEDRQTVPEEAFDNAETARMIGGIVDALPDAQRDCILLYYYDEMSVKEIAGVTGASENTVKSRLNYARRTIKENVLDYEEKQGIRLHSLAPIPLLLYFLRMAAEDGTDRAAAAEMAGKAMVQGKAAMAGAGASPGSTAAQAASHAVKGISMKTAAAAAAGILAAGGVTAGILVLNHSREESVETAAPVEVWEQDAGAEMEISEPESAGTETEPVEEAAESAEGAFLSTGQLAALPYTGDVQDCRLAVAQAESYAAVLDECIAESRAAGYQEQPFCRAALFDAGDGTPALFVVWGQDMGYGNESGYMPNVSRVFCWDGEQAAVAAESHPQEEYRFSEDTANITVTGNGLLMDRSGSSGGVYTDSAVFYSFPQDLYAGTPGHTYEEFVFRTADIPTDSEAQAAITADGALENGYSFDTLSADKWEYYPEYGEYGGRWAEDGGWLAATLDGKFLTPQEAADARKTFAWYEAEWTLGHGSKWNTDVSHFWTGDWMDAEELAALLRGGGTVPPDTEAAREETAENPDSRIRRTVFDTGGRSLEIFYEMPVFEGSPEINRFFEDKRDAFLDPDAEEVISALELTDQNPPEAGDTYRYTVSAQIMAQTDQYVSIGQTLDMYLGGMRGSETTYHNFRTDTGGLLLLSDVVDGTDSRIREMAAAALEDTEPYAKETGALERIRERDISDFNFYIKDGAVHVSFTPYDVYGMANGPGIPIEVTLPAGLKEEWKDGSF